MNNLEPLLLVIKYLHSVGVDVTPYLERIQSITGVDLTPTDVFSHKHTGFEYKIDFLPNYGHRQPYKQRDSREPMKLEKMKLERWIQDIFVRRFKEQLRLLEIENAEQKRRKKIKLPTPDNEDDFFAELVSAIVSGVSDGITLFSQTFIIGMDLTKPFENASKWAREYAFDLIKGIDETSRDVLSQAIDQFIGETGFTIGDIIDLIQPYFGDVRASMIAVTETTRAFAEGQKIAGEEMAREFPDLTIYKTWFTNNDDIVCEDCGPLDGKEIPMDEEFDPGISEPPYHVNCRCWIDYNTKVGNVE